MKMWTFPELIGLVEGAWFGGLVVLENFSSLG